METHMNSSIHEAKNENDDSLHMAARSGDEENMEAVLRRHPSLIYQQNMRGDNPLHVAARAGHLGAVELLTRFFSQQLQSGRCRQSTENDTRIDIQENEDAAAITDFFDVTFVTEKPSSEWPSLPIWRTQNDDGSTALHEALRNKHEEVALHLLDLDSGLEELVNAKDESPLYLAAEAGFVSVLNKILEAGGNPSTLGPKGQTPFHAAVLAKSKESIRVLHKWNPGLIQKRDSYGKTALYHAIREDSLKIMRLLLELKPSSACICDNEGITPLSIAASRMGHSVFVHDILNACPTLEKKALVNQADQDGNTPMHLATKGQKYHHVKELLSSKCVDLTAKNKDGHIALDLCGSDGVFSDQQKRIRHLLLKANKGVQDITMKDPTPVINTMAVVAALLATITFAAALQIPGGYKADGPNVGSPALINKPALKVFVLSDTVAFCCSMVALLYLIVATNINKDSSSEPIHISGTLVGCALVAAMIAFLSGLYSVISIESEWLAILVSVICIVVFCVCPPLLTLVGDKCAKPFRFMKRLMWEEDLDFKSLFRRFANCWRSSGLQQPRSQGVLLSSSSS